MSKESLRKRIIRLAWENPGPLRAALMPLIQEAPREVLAWERREINVPLSTGETVRVAALVSDVWAVHPTVDGPGWSLTHVPSGLAASKRIASKAQAQATVEAFARTEPALRYAKTQTDVRQFSSTIVDILRDPYEYLGGK